MKRTLLILALSVIFLLALPAADGMAANVARLTIMNGTNLSEGLGEEPAGYMLVTDILVLIREAGYDVSNITLGSNNKWALIYNVSQLKGVITIYDRVTAQGKSTGIIAQVAYWGVGSYFAAQLDSGWHYIGVVRDGDKIAVVEYDTIRIYPLRFVYETPIKRFKFLTESPADLAATN